MAVRCHAGDSLTISMIDQNQRMFGGVLFEAALGESGRSAIEDEAARVLRAKLI